MFSISVLFCSHAFIIIRNVAHPRNYYCLSQKSVSLRFPSSLGTLASPVVHIFIFQNFFCLFVFFLQSPSQTIPLLFNGHSSFHNLEWAWVYLRFPIRLTFALRCINAYIKLPQLCDFCYLFSHIFQVENLSVSIRATHGRTLEISTCTKHEMQHEVLAGIMTWAEGSHLTYWGIQVSPYIKAKNTRQIN